MIVLKDGKFCITRLKLLEDVQEAADPSVEQAVVCFLVDVSHRNATKRE